MHAFFLQWSPFAFRPGWGRFARCPVASRRFAVAHWTDA